ncbi:MAG: cytochrome b/b6 domain-containing protein [Campylobacterota bacterium]|nr:cytochrome b/b6 domain-containing protein [Campylobacterota bacterium]
MKIDVKNDLTQKYSKGTRIIHWLSTLLIFVLFGLGLSMDGLEVAEKMDLLKPHAVLGLLIFVLTLIRSVMFFRSKRPSDIKTGSKINDKLVIWIHNAFYILLLLISISGIASMILGGYGDALQTGDLSLVKAHEDIPPLKAHGAMAFFMMALVVLHVIGVVKHYIFTKENTLKRII